MQTSRPVSNVFIDIHVHKYNEYRKEFFGLFFVSQFTKSKTKEKVHFNWIV